MTQPHRPYPPHYPPYGARPPIPPRKKRWPLIVGLACGIPIALIIFVTVISVAVGGGGTDTAASSPPPPAPAAVAPAAPVSAPAASAAPAVTTSPAAGGLFQHPEDVTVVNCDRSPATGWPAASLKIVNGSSKNSTYAIRVSFQSQDGATQYGEGFVAVSSLAPGQTTIQVAQGLNDAPANASLACVVTSVQRTEAI